MDRRSLYSKRVIQEAFIQLSKEKDINDISISELCKKADLNRGTFYKYYKDLYELKKEIVDAYIDKIKRILKRYENDPRKAYYEFLMILKTHKDDFAPFINQFSDYYLINTLMEYRMRTTDINSYPNLDKNIVVTYHFAGTSAIIARWFNEGMKTPVEQILNHIMALNPHSKEKAKN